MAHEQQRAYEQQKDYEKQTANQLIERARDQAKAHLSQGRPDTADLLDALADRLESAQRVVFVDRAHNLDRALPMVPHAVEGGGTVLITRQPFNLFDADTSPELAKGNGCYWCGVNDENGVRIAEDFNTDLCEAIIGACRKAQALKHEKSVTRFTDLMHQKGG